MQLGTLGLHLKLVQQDQEVESINMYFGEDYDGWFIDALNGQYIEAYGFYGTPTLNNTVYKVL